MESKKIELEIDDIIRVINSKITEYYTLYHHEPKIIVVPDYIEDFMKSYWQIHTCVAFNEKEYSTFMGIVVVGTVTKTDITQTQVF